MENETLAAILSATPEPPKPRPGPRCTICILLGKLDDAEAEALREMLREWHATAIEKALRKAGHHFGIGAVARHKRGACSGGGSQ